MFAVKTVRQPAVTNVCSMHHMRQSICLFWILLARYNVVVDTEIPLFPLPSGANDVVSDIEYPLLAPAIIFIVGVSPPLIARQQ